MNRHNNPTLRKPKNTSCLFRATAFSKTNVAKFFDNKELAHRSWKLTADRVCNVDETWVCTVLQSLDSVAQLGTKRVWQSVSSEQGTMITVCIIINYVGNTVPPVFIFPRARLHGSLTFGAPPGSFRVGEQSSKQLDHRTSVLESLWTCAETYQKLQRRSNHSNNGQSWKSLHSSFHSLFKRKRYRISKFSSPLLSSITATGCRSDLKENYAWHNKIGWLLIPVGW